MIRYSIFSLRYSIFRSGAQLLSFLLLFFLMSCSSDDASSSGSDSTKNTSVHTIDPMAKMWNDSAASYYVHSTESDSVKGLKAAWFADKATMIDPDYYQAWFNKLTYLMASDQFDKGLEAARALTRLHPKNIDHILQYGEMLDLTGDSISAQAKYAEALNDYDVFLKAPSVKGTTLEMTKVSRAICMILQGKEAEGVGIIDELYVQHTNDNVGKMIAPLRNKGRNEILDGLSHHSLIAQNDSIK